MAVELYDVGVDPWERRDLAAAVDMAEVRQSLEGELARCEVRGVGRERVQREHLVRGPAHAERCRGRPGDV